MRHALAHSGRWRLRPARPGPLIRACALMVAVASTALVSACTGSSAGTSASTQPSTHPSSSTSASTGSAAGTSTNIGIGPIPLVTGRFGADPVIAIPNGNPSTQLIVRTLSQGSGPVVKPFDYVIFNVEGKVWAGSRQIVDSYTDRAPQGLSLRYALPAWRELAGERVGSRVLMVVPPKDGFGKAGDPAALVSGTDTLVFVFDVLSAIASNAAVPGPTASYDAGSGLPSVRWGANGPEVTIPAGAKAPKGLVRRIIVRGSGPPIVSGETVTVQYTGVVWRTGTIFDSSWLRGFPQSFVLGAGQVLPGWEQGLGGLPVGSRVMVVIPPSLGYGNSGDPPDVKNTDTVVYVFDILAALGAGPSTGSSTG